MSPPKLLVGPINNKSHCLSVQHSAPLSSRSSSASSILKIEAWLIRFPSSRIFPIHTMMHWQGHARWRMSFLSGYLITLNDIKSSRSLQAEPCSQDVTSCSYQSSVSVDILKSRLSEEISLDASSVRTACQRHPHS